MTTHKRLARRAWQAAAISLLVPSLLWASDLPTTEQQNRELRRAIESTAAKEKLVGAQVAIWHGDGIVFSTATGFANAEHSVPVTQETRFEVASVTKTFTGLAALLLEEAGHIDLDAPVQQYVPSFPTKPEGTLTARLLAGALGAVRHYDGTERTPAFYAMHYDDVARSLETFADDPLVGAPGKEVTYSSYAYNLLAAVVQSASGDRFQDHIRSAILEPMGLDNTGHIDVRYPMANRAQTYSWIDPYSREPSDRLLVVPTMEHSYNAGGGNMYSTAEDLAAFGRHFLSPGFLSKDVYAQIYSPHMTRDGDPTWFSDGWVLIGLAADPRSLIGGGSYPGVQAILRVYPDEDLVVALLTNTWGPNGADDGFTSQLSGDLAKIVLSAK